MLQYLLSAPRSIKRLITATYDAITIPLAIYAALALRHGELMVPINQAALITIAATTFLTLLIFTRTGLYRAVIRYMASKAFGTLAMGITVSALILATSSFITQQVRTFSFNMRFIIIFFSSSSLSIFFTYYGFNFKFYMTRYYYAYNYMNMLLLPQK